MEAECSEVTSHGRHPLALSPDAFARGCLFTCFSAVAREYAREVPSASGGGPFVCTDSGSAFKTFHQMFNHLQSMNPNGEVEEDAKEQLDEQKVWPPSYFFTFLPSWVKVKRPLKPYVLMGFFFIEIIAQVARPFEWVFSSNHRKSGKNLTLSWTQKTKLSSLARP